MNWLRLARKIDAFNEAIGKSVAFLTLFMVLLTFIITILRYVFRIGFISLQEAVIYMHSMVFLLVAASALKNNIHVRVDIFYTNFSQQKKALLNILGTIFILFPTMFFCLIISWKYVIFSWKYLEGSSEAGGIDLVYLLKTLLLIMPSLLIIQGISEIIKNYLFYKEKISEKELVK